MSAPPTLGTLAVQHADIYVERHGIPHADVSLVIGPAPAVGSALALTIGTLAQAGVVVSSGDFGGSSRAHWSGGTGGWPLVLPARPYHDDGGILLSRVLADLERDAAAAAGQAPLGTVLEVPDMRLDAAGSWIRPRAVGRDLLDALAIAAGQPPGAWWVAPDGSTRLGPRPASTVTLSDLTVDPFDPALMRAVVRVAGDDFAPLLPGATLTAPGLPAPLPVAALVLHVDGDDISAELWGEASHAELWARDVRHVMAGAVAYLAPQPYAVTSVASDGRVAVAAPPGSPWPDAPLVGHAPGIPGASYTLAPGAAALVSCVGGSPGAPVCVAYPPGILPASVLLDASGTVQVGGGTPLPLVQSATPAWFAQAMAAINASAAYINGIAPGTVTPVSAAEPSVTTKARGA